MIDLHNFEKFSKKSVKKEEEKLLSGFKKKKYNFFFAVGIKMFFLDETDLSRMMWNKFHSASYLLFSKVDRSS